MSHINTHRIFTNSVVLYIRVLISMLISLWTTRIVLNALGVSDYGVYNVVAGFVLMFSIVSSSLSASISRYITYELGHGNLDRLKQIFNTSLYLQYIVSVVIFILAETIGLWFINEKLNIAESAVIAANWVYQFSILSFIIDLISVPYNAAIIAHEKMKVFAYVGILSSIAKLIVAYVIKYIETTHRLAIYAGLMLFVSISIRLFYGIYCSRNFEETKGKMGKDYSLRKEITAFASWNFIGSTAGILKEQGVSIVLNIFFGPAVNAARGIAIQVSSAATTFANNFMTALNPQITKSYAAGEKNSSIELGLLGSRMGFYLMLIIALPILFETHVILKLWLVEVPAYCTIFVKLILISALIDILSLPLMTIMLATGKIRNYQIVVGTCNVLVLPISYLILKLGYPPQSTMIVAIVMSCIALLCRLIMLKLMMPFSIRSFFVNVVFRIFLVTIFSVSLTKCLTILLANLSEIKNLLAVSVGCVLLTLLAITVAGLKHKERLFIFNILKKVLKLG